MTPSDALLQGLQSTPLAVAMRDSLWLYPSMEIVHIVGFTLLVGAVILFDLRLLGLSRVLRITTLGRHLLPWSLASLLLIVPSGLLMFSAHPADFISNRVFLLKLTLIGTAGMNALAFHVGVYQSVAQWDVDAATPRAAKLHALASMAIWLTVIACGRLLAYT